MRIARLGMLGALVFAAAACQNDDGGATTPNIPPLAFVRYINAVPDTMNTTVRWIDQVEFTPTTFVNVPFRGMGQGGYQGLEAGSRRFRVFTYDPNFYTTAQLADTTFTFVAGEYYTLLHAGYARAAQVPAQRVYIFQDTRPAPGTQVHVRAYNANPLLTSVDMYLTADATTAPAGAPAFPAVGFGTSTAYSSLATSAFGAGRYTVAGDLTVVGSGAAPAGVAGTVAAPDPIGGTTIAGSMLTGVAFPASVGGSMAAASASPTVVWFQDNRPPRP